MRRATATRLSAIGALMSCVLAPIGAVTSGAHAAASATSLMLPGAGVQLDSTVYIPATTPAPAVLLAHGWAGNKTNMAGQARELQAAGYLVLAWTARGFGNSTGYIELNSPQSEGADVSRLIDYLAERGDVLLDAPGDPRVGISGGSYGGAISLIAAGLDHRLDAVAANITYNDLQQSLFPQFAVGVARSGVLKRSQAAGLFGAAQAAVPGSSCGRIEPTWCAEYKDSMSTGEPSANLSALLRAAAPATYAEAVTAPTLLMQGQYDLLFDLSESLRTAMQMCSARPEGKVAMLWHMSGHSASSSTAVSSENSRVVAQTRRWFDIHLRGIASDFPTFQVTRSSDKVIFADGSAVPIAYSSALLPLAVKSTAYPISGSTATLTSGGATSATWVTATLVASTWILTSPQVRMRVTSANGEATLFFSTSINRANGTVIRPLGLVAPIRLSNIPAGGSDVLVQLPAISAVAAAGDSLAVIATMTEPGYDSAPNSRTYTLTPLGPLHVPNVEFASSTDVVRPGVGWTVRNSIRPPVGCSSLKTLR